MKHWIVPFAAAALAAACGKSESPAAKPALPAAAVGAAPAQAALDCPPPKSGAPAGPDVIGVRLGMTRDEAMNAVRCQSPQARLTQSNRWVERLDTHGQTLGTQQFTAKSGVSVPCDFKKITITQMERCDGNILWKKVNEIVTVATPGVPGQEKVHGMWRTQRFDDGEMPSVAAAVNALQSKYGADALRRNPGQPGTAITLDWVRDPAGQPLVPGNASYNRCAYNISPYAEGAQRWSDGCGLSVVAAVVRSRTNAELAAEVHVGIADQGRLMAATEGLQAALDRLDQERRAAELKNAGDTKVKL